MKGTMSMIQSIHIAITSQASPNCMASKILPSLNYLNSHGRHEQNELYFMLQVARHAQSPTLPADQARVCSFSFRAYKHNKGTNSPVLLISAKTIHLWTNFGIYSAAGDNQFTCFMLHNMALSVMPKSVHILVLVCLNKYPAGTGPL